MYGAPLCLHGEFLDSVDLPPREFLDRIQSVLRGLTLPPPHHVAPPSACVPAALVSAEYVFVHKDASIQPLSQLYSGPYRVLICQDKFFFVETGSKQDTISIDQLKPVRETCPLSSTAISAQLVPFLPLKSFQGYSA